MDITITNSITAETALKMSIASDKDFNLKMERFFNSIRAAAEGGETELPIPHDLHFPYKQQVDSYMKGLGYRVGYHPSSRNRIVVSWSMHPPGGWRDSYELPF